MSKAQISKIIQSGVSLGSLLGKLAGPLIKVAVPLGKNILAPLGLTAAMSAIDGAIQKKKMHGSGTTTLIISNEEMNDIMKIVQALEDSNILLKGVTKRIKNEINEQKGGAEIRYCNSGTSFLRNLLIGKGTIRAGKGPIRAGKGTMRAGEGIKRKKNCNSTTSFNKL